jgi:hypothetical protein
VEQFATALQLVGASAAVQALETSLVPYPNGHDRLWLSQGRPLLDRVDRIDRVGNAADLFAGEVHMFEQSLGDRAEQIPILGKVPPRRRLDSYTQRTASAPAFDRVVGSERYNCARGWSEMALPKLSRPTWVCAILVLIAAVAGARHWLGMDGERLTGKHPSRVAPIRQLGPLRAEPLAPASGAPRSTSVAPPQATVPTVPCRKVRQGCARFRPLRLRLGCADLGRPDAGRR